jgi:hypothetical protein
VSTAVCLCLCLSCDKFVHLGSPVGRSCVSGCSATLSQCVNPYCISVCCAAAAVPPLWHPPPCRYLALDEADRMVDLGFEEEVSSRARGVGGG